MEPIAQVSGRGTVTLPAEVRRTLGLTEGDVLTVRVEGGRIVLTPAAITPIELYTDTRTAEFAASAEMSDKELAGARRRWKASGRKG